MSFATEYLAQLETFAARGALPRVKALHLPPPPEDPGSNKGEFCALELEDGAIGQSFVLLDDTLARLRDNGDSLGLCGADALAAARAYVDGTGIRRTLGFAAANALTRCLFDRAGFVPQDSPDSIGAIDPQPGEHIGMIGLFKPLLGRILDSGARLTVAELNSELAGEHDGFRVTLDATDLLDCGKVVSTGTLLLNDTLDRMLANCRNARWFAMVGPTAGCLPDALFARGVTLLGGSWVVDGKNFIEALRAGESRGPAAHKFVLTPQTYPGTNVLLERL